MRKMVNEKLKMVKDHIESGKSLSHISEKYDIRTVDIKYFILLYENITQNNRNIKVNISL